MIDLVFFLSTYITIVNVLLLSRESWVSPRGEAMVYLEIIITRSVRDRAKKKEKERDIRDR